MISFRKIKSGDLKFFIEIRNECADWLDDNTRFTLQECQEWFDSQNPRYYILEYSGKDVGYFRTSSWDFKNGSIFVGCDIHESFRGMGIAKLAYPKFMDYMTSQYGFEKYYLNVLEFNNRAISLYSKLGFVKCLTEYHAIQRDHEKINRIRMVKNNKLKNGASLETQELEVIETSEGSLFPVYKNWEKWHNNYTPEMVYVTTINSKTSKGPILHQKRHGFMTAITGHIIVECLVDNKIESYTLRDESGVSIILRIPPGIPNLIKNISKDSIGTLINLPCPAWHPDNPDTLKFLNWKEYRDWRDDGKA